MTINPMILVWVPEKKEICYPRGKIQEEMRMGGMETLLPLECPGDSPIDKFSRQLMYVGN